VPPHSVRPFYTIRAVTPHLNSMTPKGHAQEAFAQFDPVWQTRRLPPLPRGQLPRASHDPRQYAFPP
jgi:hypothetical protein